LAVEQLDEAPQVPVAVRYDPATCGPDVAQWPAPQEGAGASKPDTAGTVQPDRLEAVSMEERSTKVAELLHQAAETHHQVFRITDGADDDWASWYAEWLVTLSELPELLDAKIVRSELTYVLVRLDKEYAERRSAERWEHYYARELVRHFSAS
jgi:hypothetical protein